MAGIGANVAGMTQNNAGQGLPDQEGQASSSGNRGFHPYKPVLQSDDTFTNQETNTTRPLTDAVLTVRIIKSFAYRNMKALVLKGLDLTTMSVADLEERCRKEIATAPTFKPFRTYASQLDTMKLYTRAHGSKTTNLIINLDHPEWVLDGEQKGKTLQEVGCENETELSFFNRSEYEAFLENPETTW